MSALGLALRRAFSRRYWVTTVLVLLAVPVMVRLGFWQLDRLAQKRAYIVLVQERLNAPPQPLRSPQDLAGGPETWRFRRVVVEGEFDFAHQVAVRNRFWQGHVGYHLLAPLRLRGSEYAILVDRGWIPPEKYDPALWAQYDEPGIVRVQGYLMESETSPGGSDVPARSGSRLVYWADVKALGAQIPYPLLPAVLLQEPLSPVESSGTVYPVREGLRLDLSEGPHLGYAIQWFLFSVLLPGGYLYWLARDEGRG